MLKKDVSLTPTLSIQVLLKKYGRELGVNEWGLNKINEVMEGAAVMVPKANKLGLNILCGTDLGFETGRDIDIGKNWTELIFLAEMGGLTPVESLRTATGNAGKIGMKAGTIKPGLPADIVVINGDPGEDIREIEKITEVFRNGREVISG